MKTYSRHQLLMILKKKGITGDRASRIVASAISHGSYIQQREYAALTAHISDSDCRASTIRYMQRADEIAEAAGEEATAEYCRNQ